MSTNAKSIDTICEQFKQSYLQFKEERESGEPTYTLVPRIVERVNNFIGTTVFTSSYNSNKYYITVTNVITGVRQTCSINMADDKVIETLHETVIPLDVVKVGLHLFQDEQEIIDYVGKYNKASRLIGWVVLLLERRHQVFTSMKDFCNEAKTPQPYKGMYNIVDREIAKRWNEIGDCLIEDEYFDTLGEK